MFVSKDELKIMIIDFGMAQRYFPGTQMTQPFGTPNYMAPEVIKGRYEEKCDLWSVGILTFIMLSGIIPFKAKNVKELLTVISGFQNMDFNIPELRNKSIGAIDFMKKCIHIDPNMRASAYQLIGHSWLFKFAKYALNQATIQRALACFRNYRSVKPIQKKVIEFILKELFVGRAADNYRNIFYEINSTADGMCTK